VEKPYDQEDVGKCEDEHAYDAQVPQSTPDLGTEHTH
jgi:hypothetical protein